MIINMATNYKLLEKPKKECQHLFSWIFPKDKRHDEIIKQHPSLKTRGGCVILCDKCNAVSTST